MDYHATSLPAGAYRIHLSGMDWKNLCAMKFDYPIVGEDENGNPLIPPAPFTVGDLVWNDTTPDGVRAPSEPGIAGVLVNLIDGVSGSVVGTATTDANGAYTITAWNGSYRVELPAASNFTPGDVLYGWQASGVARTHSGVERERTQRRLRHAADSARLGHARSAGNLGPQRHNHVLVHRHQQRHRFRAVRSHDTLDSGLHEPDPERRRNSPSPTWTWPPARRPLCACG